MPASVCLVHLAERVRFWRDKRGLFIRCTSHLTCAISINLFRKFTSLTALLIAVLLVVADVIFNRITSINKRQSSHTYKYVVSTNIVVISFTNLMYTSIWIVAYSSHYREKSWLLQSAVFRRICWPPTSCYFCKSTHVCQQEFISQHYLIACALSSGLGLKWSKTQRRAQPTGRCFFCSSTLCSGHAPCSFREY